MEEQMEKQKELQMDELRVLDQINFNFVIELDQNTKVNIREDLEKTVGMEVEGFKVDGIAEGALDGGIEDAKDGMEVEGFSVEGVPVGMEVEGFKIDGTAEGAPDGRVEGARVGMEVDGSEVDGRADGKAEGAPDG